MLKKFSNFSENQKITENNISKNMEFGDSDGHKLVFLDEKECNYTHKGKPKYLKTSDSGLIFEVGENEYPITPMKKYVPEINGDWNYIIVKNDFVVDLDNGDIKKTNSLYKNGFEYPTKNEIEFFEKIKKENDNISEDKNITEPLVMVSENKNVQTFTKEDLKDAFSHYAFTTSSQQPYNEEELDEEFNEWFDDKYKNILEEETEENSIVESINESFQPQQDKIYSIKTDLENKYSTNEAIESISIEDDEEGKFIQFNIKCETDIEGTSMEYNGYRLKYNHICEINSNKDEEIIITENYKKNTFGI